MKIGRRSYKRARAGAAPVILMLAACGGGNVGSIQNQLTAEPGSAIASDFGSKEVCPHTNVPGQAYCHARVRTDEHGIVQFSTTPAGFGPSDLASAYNIPATGGMGKIVAVVDAFDNPNAESDLGVYRSQFGLTPCTTESGCFQKINQDGEASPLPVGDEGWGSEISLDLDMVSSGCPDCKILLVEANSQGTPDLVAAVQTAIKLGAVVVSNSYGFGETSDIVANDATNYNHPGVTIFASSGDGGYGVIYPSSSQYVVAVGGTSLYKNTSPRGFTETVWGSRLSYVFGGGGSGCSQYIAKPSWQKDTGCSKRTVADVSAVADPDTGVAVYDTYGGGSWAVYGGTSASSPLVAAIYTITGNHAAGPSLSYAKPSAFYDVTTGSNGFCDPSYLCDAGVGYDGPTGMGTPNGSAL
jgi:subtilase family serine protease